MSDIRTRELLYTTDPTNARNLGNLAHKMPNGFHTLEALDEECERLVIAGKVAVINSITIDNSMRDIKQPDLSLKQFREHADVIIGQLVYGVAKLTIPNPKIAISVRAGLAFLHPSMKFMPDAEVGYATQARDEETAECKTQKGKLGTFAGKHAIIFDPMLATGGSMVDLMDEVTAEGATGITTVSMFTAPQGLVRVSQHPNVQLMLTTPLEAGLNENAYIVGGHQPYPMLGDFGDRFFGSLS